jgi:hypothetical protein
MNDSKLISQSRIVGSHDLQIDVEYAEWIAEVKQRYRAAQLKAAVKVNSEKLLFNWQLGADLVLKKAEERWGEGVVERLSRDLLTEFPDVDGFTPRNLWFMKQWYLFYSQPANSLKLKQVVSVFEEYAFSNQLALDQVGKTIVKTENVKQLFQFFQHHLVL